MKTLGSRIREMRKQHEITQNQLAKSVGVSHVTISQWESDTTAPKGENLYRLAQILSISAAWLISGLESDKAEQDNSVTLRPRLRTRLPVISATQAANWTAAMAKAWQEEHANDALKGEELAGEEAPITAADTAFWMKVEGDSMAAIRGPSIPEGHLILVDPTIEAVHGSLVVAKLKSSDQVTFKKLMIDAGRKYLSPINPDYQVISGDHDCRIVGVIKEAKVRF